MAKQVQLRRGSASDHTTFTGAVGELTYVSDDKTLRIHDGSTAGGIYVGTGVINVKSYGATGDGVTDDTTAIQAALDSGGKDIFLPEGTYKITATLTVPKDVNIKGAGISATVIDGSSSSFGDLTSGQHIVTADPGDSGWTELSVALSGTYDVGDVLLTFASDMTSELSVGDIILFHDSADDSWMDVTGENYEAGEVHKIGGVGEGTSANTEVFIQGSLADNYNSATATLKLYKLTTSTTSTLSDFSLTGLADTSNAVCGIRIIKGVNCKVKNVKITNCSDRGLVLKQCYFSSVTDCHIEEDMSLDFGMDYGLVISNSSYIRVSGGFYCSARHGITLGGGAAIIGAVSCRHIMIQGVYCASSLYDNADSDYTDEIGAVGALMSHANAEYVLVQNCIIDGGAVPAGDYHTYTGNIIRGKGNGQALIYGTNFRGGHLTISNNTFQTRYPGVLRGTFVDLGGNSTVFDACKVAGTIHITNNHMEYTHGTPISNSQTTGNWIKIQLRDYPLSEFMGINITGNSITYRDNTEGGYALVTTYTTADQWETINFSNNTSVNCGGLKVNAVSTATKTANHISMIGNTITSAVNAATQHGLYATDALSTVVVKDNHMTRIGGTPILVYGNSTTDLQLADISNNTIYEGCLTRTGSSTTDVDIIVNYVVQAIIKGNVCGTDVKDILVDDATGFTLGETITFTTGGTATVVALKDGTNRIGVAQTYDSGGITTGDTVTGGTSTNTATLSGVLNDTHQTRNIRAANFTTVWHGNNVNLGSATLFDSDSSGTVNTI